LLSIKLENIKTLQQEYLSNNIYMSDTVDRMGKYVDFESQLRSRINDDSFYSIPVNERGNYVAGLIEGFSKINNLNEDDKDYIGKLAEEQLTDFRISNNIPRFVPTQEQAAELFDRFPDTSTDERVEDVERKVDAWKASSLAKASALRPAEREDIETYLNRSSNNFIREEAARLNDTGWFMDKGYRAVEELAKPFHQLLDPDGSDRFWAKSAPENPSYDQDFTSLIAGGIGQVIPQIAISIGLTAAGSPEAIPAVFTALYGAEYMQNGYREEFARSGDEGKAWDNAVSQIPAALLETVGDTLLVRGVTKTARQFGKEFASASTMEAKKAILRKALPTMGKAAKEGFIAEAFVGGMAAEWASGYGSYLATGDENYLRSTKDIIKGGLAEGIVGGLTAGLLHGVTNDSTRKAFAQDVSTLTGLKVKQEEIYAALKNGDFQKVIDITNKDIITDPAQQDATLDVVDKARAAINGKPITEEEKAATPKASSLVIPSTTRVKIRQDIENIDKELSDPSVTEERSNELNKRKQYLTDVNEKINNGTYEELNEVKGTVDTTSVYRNHEAIGKNDKGLTTQEITLDNGERFSYTTDDIPVFLQSNTFKQTLNGIVARFGQENVTVDLVATSGNAVIKWTEDGKKKHSQGFPYTRTPRKGFTPLTLNENGTLKIHNPINEIKYAGNARNVEVVSDDTTNNIITVKNKKGETITLDGERANTLRASIPNYKPEEVAKEKAEDTKPKEKKASVVDNSAQEKLTFERGNVPIVADGERRFLHKETNKMGVVVKDNGTLLFKPDDNSTPIELGGAESQITLNDAGLTRELDVRTPTEVDTNDIVDILEHEQIQSEKQSKPTTTVDKKAATTGRFYFEAEDKTQIELNGNQESSLANVGITKGGKPGSPKEKVSLTTNKPSSEKKQSHKTLISSLKEKLDQIHHDSIDRLSSISGIINKLISLGVEYKVMSREEIAKEYGENNSPGFATSDGKIVFNLDALNATNKHDLLFKILAIHESAHAGIYIVAQQNPELYQAAKESVNNNPELIAIAREEYGKYDNGNYRFDSMNQDGIFHETIRMIIEGRLAGRTTGLSESGPLKAFLQKLIDYIRNIMWRTSDRIVFQFVKNVEDVLGVTNSAIKIENENITVNDIPSNIVSDFVRIINGEDVDLENYKRDQLRDLADLMRIKRDRPDIKERLLSRIKEYKPISDSSNTNIINNSQPIIVGSDFFADSGKFYRVIQGDESLNDILQSGEVRTNAAEKIKSGMTLAEKMAARPTAFPSFSKGSASMSYAAENPNHSIIVTADKSLQPSTSGRHSAGKTHFPTVDGVHQKSLGNNFQVYKHIGNGEYELVFDKGMTGEIDNAPFSLAPRSQQDTDYLAAVKAGDMETAQAMVDAAAKAAGYNVGPVFHGTKGKKKGVFPFDVFEMRVGKNTKGEDNPIPAAYFSENKGVSEGAAFMQSNMGRDGKPVVGRFFLKGVKRREDVQGDVEYRVTNPNQIKSADPVTRDESGNVIPLSQRFDSTNNNIQNSQPINLGDKFSFRLANSLRNSSDAFLGLKIANDGTLPTQSLIAKVRKSGITEFEVDSITNLINSLEDNGRVNISELSASIDNEPTLVINTLDYSGGSVSRRAELEHNFDTINPSWRDIVDRGNDKEINSLPASILDNIAEWMDIEETGKESATGRFDKDPYSNEVLSGAEIEPGHRLIWSGDLSLNIPIWSNPIIRQKQIDNFEQVNAFAHEAKFTSQHYNGDVAKNQLAFVRGGIHEYQKGNKLPDGTIAQDVTRIFEIWEVQSDWEKSSDAIYKDGVYVGAFVDGLLTDSNINLKDYDENISDNILEPKDTKKGRDSLIKNGYTIEKKSPLIKYWESLALKAAMNHAKKQGASNIIISDADTAMTTEGHDKNAIQRFPQENIKAGDYVIKHKNHDGLVLSEAFKTEAAALGAVDQLHEAGEIMDYNVEVVLVKEKDKQIEITQEKGMRAAYDERIPNGLSKLSNSKGKKVTVGEHNKGPSKVFKNPDGTPKNTNTGLMFPVNNNVELQFSQPITNEENTNEGESKSNENIIDEVVDSEYEHTDTVLGTPISPFRKTQIERLNKLRSVKIEALLSVEDKALFKSIKAIKALAALNDDVLAEYVTLYEDFVSTRSNNIDAGVSRPASSELINKLSSLTEKAKQAWFEEQKDTFPELAQKDFQKDFQGKMDYVNDFISKLSGMEETTGTDKVSKNKEAFLAKIDNLRAVVNENYDQMKEDLFSRMDLDFKESDNPHIQKGIELMRARMNDSKEWYGEFLNHLLNVDVVDMSAKNVRNTYYALMSVAYDGYVMNTDGFVSNSINDLLADSEGVVPLNTFTSTAAARVVPNLMSTSTKARSIVSNKGYIALQKIASNFRESLKQSHMMHELALVPYQKESIDNAQKKSGKRYSDSDLQRIGIYAISRRIRIGFDVKSEIERNISQIKDSILVLSRSGDKKLRRASEWYNKYIDTLFDGVLKSETPLETLESNAVNAGIDDGMKGYVNDIVNFFDAFKPIAKFTKEFIYNREFIDEHNYVPTMILNLDESKGPLQYNTDDVTLNMTPEDTSERNVNTNGMSGTFDRSARLKENQALVFNINHLFSNRGRLNFLDAFSAVRRKEISTLLNAKTQKGQEMRDFLGDEFGGQFRYHTFIDFVKTQWKAEIESVQYIHQYQSVINGALSRWGGFALSSVYQGVMQLTSNIAPFMMANIGNPQKISAMFKAYDYMNRHRAGLLTPQQALIYEKVLFDVAHRHQDQVLDTSVNLGITQDGLWQAFKSSAIANGISKVDKIIDKVKFFQFRTADFLSGAPVMLAEYLDAEQKRLGAEMTFEDLVYDPGSYAIALDETERFIGIGNATRRGEWMTSRDAPITILRHMLTGFAGHRVNNATNFYVEMRKIANENISSEEKLKSASYVAGIISQSVIFSAGKVAIIYFLMSATKGILDGNDSDDDKVEELYRNRANAQTEKEKKLIDAEIAKRKQIRAVWKKAIDRQSDSYLFTMGLSKDIISNIFVSANLFEPIVDKLLYFPIDEHEEKMFKELKAKRTEALESKIKNAKSLGDTGSLVELQRQLADTQASEFLRMTHPSFGNIIPYGGMYGGVSRNLEKVFDASLNPDTLTLNDVSNMAAAFGWNLADVSRITRIMESVDDAKLEAEKKKRRLNGN